MADLVVWINYLLFVRAVATKVQGMITLRGNASMVCRTESIANRGLEALEERVLAVVHDWESGSSAGGSLCGFPSFFGYCFVGKPLAFV